MRQMPARPAYGTQMRSEWAPCLLFSALLWSCASDDDADVASTDSAAPSLPPAPVENATLLFQDVTSWSGLARAGNDTGPGVSAIDVNDDGLDDVLFSSGPGLGVWLNRGDGSFSDPLPVTSSGGMAGFGAQLVGEAHLDMMVVHGDGLLELYEGLGDGRFRPMPSFPSPPRAGTGASVTFGDFDYSGRLSVFFARTNLPCPESGRLSDGSPCNERTSPSSLPAAAPVYFSHTESGFVDTTAAAGLAAPARLLAAMAIDVNGDGPLDLILGTDGGVRDPVYLSNGKGSFVERGLELGFERGTAAMGLDAADIDGDGDMEIFVSDQFPSRGGVLWEKGPSGRYLETGAKHGLGELEQYSVWGVGLHDFDSDGDIDLMCCSGSPMGSDGTAVGQERLYFENDGTGLFTRRTANGSALDLVSEARGMAFADFDDDGDIDAVVSSLRQGVQLLRNDLPQGNAVKLRLDYPWYGPVVGAVVTVSAGAKSIRRWVTGTPSFGGSSSMTIHVGIGGAPAADAVEVRWPHGATQVFSEPVAAGTTVTLTYAP
ncbi:MAG: CRTAC1 family protein [Myxococcales bacterium]|nr:CRTAC1 family protein [Myxococcales bacterium]